MDLTALNQAIAGVQTSETNLNSADSAQLAAQAQFDAATSAKTVADQADVDAKTAFNASIDALVAAATAAKL